MMVAAGKLVLAVVVTTIFAKEFINRIVYYYKNNPF
jgi:hypothetical protein